MSEITFDGVWDDNDPPHWETFTVMLHGAEAGDWVSGEDVAATLARNGWQCGPVFTLSAALELPEVRALVEAMERAIEAIDAAYDGPDDNGAYTVRERAALAAIKEQKP